MKPKIRNSIKIFIIMMAAVVLSAAGIPSAAASDVPSAIHAVAVSPESAEVAKGASCTFTASVTGENDYSSEVVWSLSGQTSQSTFIDTKGVLNVAADEGAENIVVKAVSRQDSAYSATALAVIRNASYKVNITVNDGNGGTATESKTVNAGESMTIKATPKDGWRFVEWRENDKSVGNDAEMTLENITGDRNLTAVFEQDTPKTYKVAAAVATVGGIITPTGTSPVPAGSWIGYAITPDSGFRVRMVYVDGAAVGAATSYNFTDVQGDHTISAEFEPDPAQAAQNQAAQTTQTPGSSTADHDDPEKAGSDTADKKESDQAEQKPSEKTDDHAEKEKEKAEKEAAAKAEREKMEKERMEKAQADAEAERTVRIEQEKAALAQEKAEQAAAQEEAAQKRTKWIIFGIVAAVVALCAAGVFVVVRR
ncbi:MAG: hypothetical protein NC302_07700 [Bacteroidales bacterium]|nr:hypothetical protein [Bacteroidales bacterium]MCM1414953.1 hypothetical protein [bacterium]MCM1423168.1 hypothetical protein [bacterium]